jgi:hypothetical protein
VKERAMPNNLSEQIREWDERAVLVFLVVALFVLSSTHVAAQYLPTYTVSLMPGGIKELPCSAFRKNGPNSWTLIANVYSGGTSMSNVTFHKGDELKMIEEKCGTK